MVAFLCKCFFSKLFAGFPLGKNPINSLISNFEPVNLKSQLISSSERLRDHSYIRYAGRGEEIGSQMITYRVRKASRIVNEWLTHIFSFKFSKKIMEVKAKKLVLTQNLTFLV